MFSGSARSIEEQQGLMDGAVLGTGLVSPSGGIAPQSGGQLPTASSSRNGDSLPKLVVFSESHFPHLM